MSKIIFETTSSVFTIKNPYNDFAEETHELEIRKDPLLGDTSVYRTGREKLDRDISGNAALN